jgi:hypothetical protein
VNIIQNGQLIRGIQNFTGMRQAHIAPAVTEGLQVTLQASDIRSNPRTQTPLSYAAVQEITSDGVNPRHAIFQNPILNQTIVRLRRLHVFNQATGLVSILVYNLINKTPTAIAVNGQRLTNGYQGVGVAPPLPLEFQFPQPKSLCGWQTSNPTNDGIDGGYIWESTFGDGAAIPTEVPYEILENFNDTFGPHIDIWPGGYFQVYVLDANSHFLANLWWDEFPIS